MLSLNAQKLVKAAAAAGIINRAGKAVGKQVAKGGKFLSDVGTRIADVDKTDAMADRLAAGARRHAPAFATGAATGVAATAIGNRKKAEALGRGFAERLRAYGLTDAQIAHAATNSKIASAASDYLTQNKIPVAKPAPGLGHAITGSLQNAGRAVGTAWNNTFGDTDKYRNTLRLDDATAAANKSVGTAQDEAKINEQNTIRTNATKGILPGATPAVGSAAGGGMYGRGTSYTPSLASNSAELLDQAQKLGK